MTMNEREDRALEALIVSQLRRNDETESEHLPQLSDEDKSVLDSLGPDFIDRLYAEEAPMEEQDSDGVEEHSEEMLAGMNRAENIDDDTKAELDRKRKEIIDRLKGEQEEDDE